MKGEGTRKGTAVQRKTGDRRGDHRFVTLYTASARRFDGPTRCSDRRVQLTPKRRGFFSAYRETPGWSRRMDRGRTRSVLEASRSGRRAGGRRAGLSLGTGRTYDHPFSGCSVLYVNGTGWNGHRRRSNERLEWQWSRVRALISWAGGAICHLCPSYTSTPSGLATFGHGKDAAGILRGVPVLLVAP